MWAGCSSAMEWSNHGTGRADCGGLIACGDTSIVVAGGGISEGDRLSGGAGHQLEDAEEVEESFDPFDGGREP
jgi:phosphoribosylformylglycinamidine (FGAM) synthase-like amidotransferase family enzyme